MTSIGSPQGGKSFQTFWIFSRPLGPKLKESGPGAGTSFFPMFFCGRARAESPGDDFSVDFPAGPGTGKFLVSPPKFLDAFLELLPPKTAETGPGTVTSFFPMLFSCPGSCGELGRPRFGRDRPCRLWTLFARL